MPTRSGCPQEPAGRGMLLGDRLPVHGNTFPMTSPPTPATEPLALLGSARASWFFVVTVFLTTVVQALVSPTVALLEGATGWPLPVPIAGTYALLILGCALQAGVLFLTQRMPRLTIAFVVAIHLALATGLSVPTWVSGMSLPISVAIFLGATRLNATRAIAWCAAVIVAESVVLLCWAMGAGESIAAAVGWLASQVMSLAAPAVGGTALGLWWSVKARRMRVAREAAESAAREHDERVAEAQRCERARIAQELHDVAGQHLAGLITLADAALKVAPTRAEQALELLQDVRDEGRFAAAGLAGALADLRVGGVVSSDATQDLRDLDELVGFWRARGAVVALDVVGSLDSLPAVVSATAFRGVQEALTNAAKHAPGAPVDVRVSRSPGRISVAVANAAAAPVGDLSGISLGWGLSGIRERVEILGGSLSAGEDVGGGWSLGFVIPVASTEAERS
ncbi:Sensor histidine kinase DesK [Microbacterium oleivorans]|uniref:histidine kinase n=2 Tax=Microbacterium oleivorans TaxID=273677 RepID=A0A031FYK8_9MICO|nr:Sensor histidine kinase DesK [Microbacterium oleivorans]EZP29291.1 putative signal transduction histidine kinase [Microbacterium oleivorans]